MAISKDALAAIAMHGLLSRTGPGEFDFDAHPADVLRVADWASNMADVMIKFRNSSDEEKHEMYKIAKQKLSYNDFVMNIIQKQHREEDRKKREKLKQKQTKKGVK